MTFSLHQGGVVMSSTAHQYTYALPYCITSQYRRTFINLSVSLWNDLADPVFNGVGLACFKSRANAFCWPKLFYLYYRLLLFFPSSYFCPKVGIAGLSLRTDRVYSTLSQPCTADLF